MIRNQDNVWKSDNVIDFKRAKENRLLDGLLYVSVIDKNQFGFIYAELMNQEKRNDSEKEHNMHTPSKFTLPDESDDNFSC